MQKKTAIILITAFGLGLVTTIIGEFIMTPAENIYRSDYDEVDSVLQLDCDSVELEPVPEDDGQPTIYEEYQDLYGGDDYDFGQYDYIEGEW